MMKLATRFAMMVSGTMLVLGGGSCLPEMFWADKAGEILNGLIINGLDSVLVPAIGFGI